MNYLHTETNRELSKLMDAKGCKSESGLLHMDNGRVYNSCQWSEFGTGERPLFPAFNFEDCVRPDNARLVWGEEKTCFLCGGTKVKGIEIRTDYGTGVEHDAICVKCGVAWMDKYEFPEDGTVISHWDYQCHKLLDAFHYDPGEGWMQLLIQQLKV